MRPRGFIENWLIERLNTTHPDTDPSRCAWCGKSKTPDGTLLPIAAPAPVMHGCARTAGRHGASAGARPPSRRWLVWGICAFVARLVRFFAFIFFMRLRTWTFTVLSHMFNSQAMTLFGLPIFSPWIGKRGSLGGGPSPRLGAIDQAPRWAD
jgi:hypothetical protein